MGVLIHVRVISVDKTAVARVVLRVMVMFV